MNYKNSKLNLTVLSSFVKFDNDIYVYMYIKMIKNRNVEYVGNWNFKIV